MGRRTEERCEVRESTSKNVSISPYARGYLKPIYYNLIVLIVMQFILTAQDRAA